MPSRRGLCCGVLLAAALLAAAPGAAAVDLCERYGKAECLLHSDTCTHCTTWGGKFDVCFQTDLARRLPAKLFTCDAPPPPPPPANADCQDLSSQQACASVDTCVWCISAAVPSACYTEEEARRLPAAVFKCTFSSFA